MKHSRLCLFLLVFGLLAFTSRLVAKESSPRPNVILIMADDLGYNDLSCYGGKTMQTPVLDQLANEGLRLTNFHAGAAVCTPSRMALLTGCYPVRLGWEGGVIGYGMKKYSGLPRRTWTIAEAFKAAGYRTALAGKWHLGAKELQPMHHGFDDSFFIPNSNNMKRDLTRGDKVITPDADNKRLSEIFTREAIRQITTSSDKPLFLYLPYTAPHFPAEAHPDWKGKSANKAYGDVVEELDHRIGEIFDALKKQNLDKNTLVIFLSDNGPEKLQRGFSKADPYSGGKWGVREGSTRVPCIVWWPGVIKPGQVQSHLTSAIDLYPTLAEACGFKIEIPKSGQRMDGVSVWLSWLDTDLNPNAHARKELMYWNGRGLACAIQMDGMKLFFGKSKDAPEMKEGPVLFNLKHDVQETKDISQAHPEIVKTMLRIAKAKLEDIHQHHIPIGTWDEHKDKIKDWQPKRNWGQWVK